MNASAPGTVQMSAPASDGSTATATANYDPTSLDLLDPFITTSATTQLQFDVTLASDGVTTYTWTVPPGSSIAAADLASMGLTTWDEIDSIAFSAS